MTKKIFTSICTARVAVFLAASVLAIGVLYDYFSRQQQQQIKVQTALASRGIAAKGREFFDEIDTGEYRVTWIAPDGRVLFDTRGDQAKMENHLDREEVKEAMEKGSGQSLRYSSTLTKKLFYCAQQLPDGSVVRLSVSQYTVLMLIAGIIKPLALGAVFAAGLLFFMARHLSTQIVKPLNEIDFDRPAHAVPYEEIKPFLNKIENQQSQLRNDRQELEKLETIRQEFTANVSHELKTPLHSIAGYAELLKNGLVKPEDVQPFAQKIYSESMRMSNLVNDIIDLSHLDTGAKDMRFEETDLYLIAQNAADSLSRIADAAGVEIQIRGQSAKMRGIPQLLYGVIYNLCDNGVKYNRRGGKVWVNVENGRDTVTLTVADNGIGIPQKDKDRVFERFYRVDKSRSKAVGGTGLGLSIVKHSAIIHNASLSLDSAPGKGSKFTIVFPKTEKQG